MTVAQQLESANTPDRSKTSSACSPNDGHVVGHFPLWTSRLRVTLTLLTSSLKMNDESGFDHCTEEFFKKSTKFQQTPSIVFVARPKRDLRTKCLGLQQASAISQTVH